MITKSKINKFKMKLSEPLKFAEPKGLKQIADYKKLRSLTNNMVIKERVKKWKIIWYIATNPIKLIQLLYNIIVFIERTKLIIKFIRGKI